MENKLPSSKIITFGGYKWMVLETDRDKTLIITKNIIEKRAYHLKHEDVTWESCSLRAYLNTEFYSRFSDDDKKRIAKVQNSNPDNRYLTHAGKIRTTVGGNPTEDFIFLLNIDEVKRHFHTKDVSDDDTGNEETPKNRLSWAPSSHPQSDELVAVYKDKPWRWWLRSPGFVSNHAAYVYDDGTVNFYGYNILNAYAGVRPALYLLNS